MVFIGGLLIRVKKKGLDLGSSTIEKEKLTGSLFSVLSDPTHAKT